jgi:hypothetical protein
VSFRVILNWQAAQGSVNRLPQRSGAGFASPRMPPNSAAGLDYDVASEEANQFGN